MTEVTCRHMDFLSQGAYNKVGFCLTRTRILQSQAYIKQKPDRTDYLYSFISCLMSCRHLYQ